MSPLLFLWAGLAFAQDPPPEWNTVMVIVAARDLYAGVTITEEDLYAVEIPPRYLPEGVFLSPDHVLGQIPHTRILANEFIRAGRVTLPPERAAAEIPLGHRLIALSVAPTPRTTSGLVDLVGRAGCLAAEDVYARAFHDEGAGTTLTAVVRIEDIGRVDALARAGALSVAVPDERKRERCPS